jgi:hypothetical protein
VQCKECGGAQASARTRRRRARCKECGGSSGVPASEKEKIARGKVEQNLLRRNFILVFCTFWCEKMTIALFD